MKIRVLSDLHLEFMTKPDAAAFVKKLALPGSCDVLVLAGDVSNAVGIRHGLHLFAAASDVRIVYVAGNHEFYGSSPNSVWDTICAASSEIYALSSLADEFPALEMGLREIDGRRFLGCSLWFPPPKRGDKSCLNDFRLIRDFEPWVYERNRASVAWLRENVRPGDVVVTHHLPTPSSIHPRYAGSALNEFFMTDLHDLIVEREPALWIHGHTHDSFDYKIGPTRVVCNPYGYAGHDTNNGFDPMKVVEL